MNAQNPREFLDRRQLVAALRALRRGDFSVRLSEDGEGIDAEIGSLFNEVVSLNEEMAQESEEEGRFHGFGETLKQSPPPPAGNSENAVGTFLLRR